MKKVILYDKTKINDFRSQSSLVQFLDGSFNLVDVSTFEKINIDSINEIYLNLADDGVAFANDEEYIPQLLQVYKAKFVGSNSESIRIASNKVSSKLVLKDDEIISVPKFTIYDPKNGRHITDIDYFPVIVKPVYTTGSIGITVDSIIYDLDSLVLKLNSLSDAVIIEEYIEGEECTVSVIGNPSDLRILPVLWYLNSEKRKVLTFDAKWNPESKEYQEFTRVLKEPDESLTHIMSHLYEKFRFCDYLKADFIKRGEEYYLVDISPNPTITERSDFFFQYNGKYLENENELSTSVINLYSKLFEIAEKRISN